MKKSFLQNQVSGKNLILELWYKDPQANQGTGFLNCNISNELQYEVKFLYMVRNPWKL